MDVKYLYVPKGNEGHIHKKATSDSLGRAIS
jgi:hypothetical protein